MSLSPGPTHQHLQLLNHSGHRNASLHHRGRSASVNTRSCHQYSVSCLAVCRNQAQATGSAQGANNTPALLTQSWKPARNAPPVELQAAHSFPQVTG